MAQREVVDRWLAPPGGRLYGVPSVLLGLTAEPTFRRSVGREVFLPRPRVDSALVALRRTAPGPAAGGAGAGAGGLRRAPKDAGQRARGRRGRQGGDARGPRRRSVTPPASVPRPWRPPTSPPWPWSCPGAADASAPAKLNLRLAVGPRGDDGYHPVTSLMIALDGLRRRPRGRAAPGSAASRCPASRGRPTWSGGRWTRWRPRPAARFRCEVRIDKRIPSQAGLGGGSSDAAAALVAVDRLYGLGLGTAAAGGRGGARGRGRALLRARRSPVGRGARRAPAAGVRPGVRRAPREGGVRALHRRGLRGLRPAAGARRPPAGRAAPGLPRSRPGRATTSGRRRSRWRPAWAPAPAPSRRRGPGRCSCAGADRASPGCTRTAPGRPRPRGGGREAGSAPW